jgi:hypothetical protein
MFKSLGSNPNGKEERKEGRKEGEDRKKRKQSKQANNINISKY